MDPQGAVGELPFEIWRDAVGQTRVCDATSAHAADFRAQLRRAELGPAILFGTSFPSARFRRTERMIRASDAELYHLTLLTTGGLGLRRGRDQAETFGVGDLSILDSSHPYDMCSFGGQVSGVGVDLPVSLLPVPPDRLRDLLGRRLSGREGTGALLAQFLIGLDQQADVLRPAEAARLGTIVADLVSVWIAGALDAEETLPQGARQRAKVEGIREFIRRNLHDPALSPAVVAAAHHISVSHLHRLFARDFHGETVAAYIRRQRLAKAHRDLADPALDDLPIHAIGARCGIPGASEFGRAFKSAHGLSPSDHRRRARPPKGENV
ncbi:helix-turn-helix domain-containing protein [Kitasatospora sp. NPDC101183]|uniref:AraC-like ligand-binding domain-containing protein n=1 Tax=Kitasatospora sp. NPDC101183 TaxID=3364100 RepID=UPI0037FC1957